MADLNNLLDRVKTANVPERGLDALIAQAVAKPTDMLNGMGFDEAIERFPHDLAGIANHWPVAPFTASLDAALELVERVLPGAMWQVGFDPDDGSICARLVTAPPPCTHAKADHDYPALAVVAALLTALISRSDTEKET